MLEIDELIEHFTFLPNEVQRVGNKSGGTRIGVAVLFKFFQYEARFPTHKYEIPTEVLGYNRVAFCSLPENMDTSTPSGELFFRVFGALAQYERVVAGLTAIAGKKLDAIIAAFDGGMSKAAVCRNFGVKRTTLIESRAPVGWAGPHGASSQ